MGYQLSIILYISALLSLHPHSTEAQETVQQVLWVVPNGMLPDLSQTFTAGITLALSWNAWPSTSYIDPKQTLVNLWVTAFDIAQNPFNQLLLANINLTSPGNYAWTIAIPASNLTIDAKYVLRFKAKSSTFDPNTADLSSPGILVLANGASSTATSTSPTTTSATAASPPTSSFIRPSSSNIVIATTSSTSMMPPPTAGPCSSCGLSTGAKAGIGVGVAISVLTLAGLVYFFFITKRKTKTYSGPVRNEIESGDVGGQVWNEMESNDVSGRAKYQLSGLQGARAELPGV